MTLFTRFQIYKFKHAAIKRFVTTMHKVLLDDTSMDKAAAIQFAKTTAAALWPEGYKNPTQARKAFVSCAEYYLNAGNMPRITAAELILGIFITCLFCFCDGEGECT